MIPKIIHVCWFGRGEYSDLIKYCMASWRKHLPDYEIRLWNEETFDVESIKYTRESYKAKKYAFVSDYVRLHALYKYGGIYLDTDVEVVKSFDKFLNMKGFAGFEEELRIACGIIGAQPYNEIIKEFLEIYEGRSFYNDIGHYDLTPNPYWFKKVIKRHGLKENNITQDCDGFVIFEQTFFYPSKRDGKWQINDNTVTIHHYDGSWTKIKDDYQMQYENQMAKYQKRFGEIWGKRIYVNLMRIKKFGLFKWIIMTLDRLRSRK